MSMSALRLPLFCVQQPLQSESAQVSMASTTMVFDPDFRHRSWCFSVAKSGNTETMLCDSTQVSGIVGPQPANMPSYRQPLYLMHSSLPGAGYEVNSVLFAVFQTRPAAAHLLVAVLVEVAVPVPPVPVAVAVFNGLPIAVADPVAVSVFDAVPVPVPEPVLGAV